MASRDMIPVGYMAKNVSARPDWLKSGLVSDIFSVSDCTSHDFDYYINYWEHNGFWFFDSPMSIIKLATENSIELKGTKLFFYEAHPLEFDDVVSKWIAFDKEESFTTNIQLPDQTNLEGFDIVTYSQGTTHECSPLSCNSLAEQFPTNQHCLLSSFQIATELLETGKFKDSESGPFRIFAVYSTNWPEHEIFE